METASWKGWDDPSVVPGKEHYDDWIGNTGMNLVGDASIFPHMNQDWESTVKEKRGKLLDSVEDDRGMAEEGDTKIKLFCLHEGDVCCVEGNTKDSFVVSGVGPAYTQQQSP